MADKNFLQQYLYHRISAKEYAFGFVTEQDVDYQIRFVPTDYLFDNVPELSWKTYEFIITQVAAPPDTKPKKDERIPATIAAIFYSFYKELPDDVVIYICDSSDKRHRTRECLFNSWFVDFKSIMDESFMQMGIGLHPEQPGVIDFFVIMKLNNPHKYDIIFSLEKLKADIESEKSNH